MGKELIIWHNPRCSKSRQALTILEDAGAALTVREYLKDPPSKDELAAVVKKLGLPARRLVRSGEAQFRELRLDDADEATLLEVMTAHPILIERPVVITADLAVIGRPPETVRELL